MDEPVRRIAAAFPEESAVEAGRLHPMETPRALSLQDASAGGEAGYEALGISPRAGGGMAAPTGTIASGAGASERPPRPGAVMEPVRGLGAGDSIRGPAVADFGDAEATGIGGGGEAYSRFGRLAGGEARIPDVSVPASAPAPAPERRSGAGRAEKPGDLSLYFDGELIYKGGYQPSGMDGTAASRYRVPLG